MFDFPSMAESDVRIMSPQVLAFVGDGVYSLYIRQKLVLENKHLQGKDLHSSVINYVKAGGQSNFIEKLLPVFTEKEMAVFKRARNYKSQSQAKHASVIDYKRATGLEAVIGYLYLIGDMTRLNEILELSVGENNEG